MRNSIQWFPSILCGVPLSINYFSLVYYKYAVVFLLVLGEPGHCLIPTLNLTRTVTLAELPVSLQAQAAAHGFEALPTPRLQHRRSVQVKGAVEIKTRVTKYCITIV